MRWLILTGMLLWSASCGQKGPLYLPDEPAAQNVVSQHQTLAR